MNLNNPLVVILLTAGVGLVAAGVSWVVSTLVTHASRISVLEERTDETRAAIDRIEGKLDDLMLGRTWHVGRPRNRESPGSGSSQGG